MTAITYFKFVIIIRIPAAINIPNGDTSELAEPPAEDKYLILYCETGGRAKIAGKRMLENSYKYIMNWGAGSRWPYEFEKTPAPAGSVEN